jgi:uncharacterized protein
MTSRASYGKKLAQAPPKHGTETQMIRHSSKAAAAAILVMGALLAACNPSTPPAASDEQAAAAPDPCAGSGNFRADVICKNPALAALDAQVRERLATQATAADPSAVGSLEAEHDRWLEATRIACGVINGSPPDQDQTTCLDQRLNARLGEVQNVIQQSGGFTFRRVEDVSATAVSASAAAASGLGDMAPTAITRQISYPQIGGEQTPAIARFNELVRQEPRFRLEDQTSETVNYQIAFAGDELISVKFEILDEPLGAPHGTVELRAVTVNMRAGAPLSAADVFRTGSGWENFVTRRVLVDLTRQMESAEFVPSERDVRETVTKPQNWLVTENAMVLLLAPLSFAGPQVDGGQEIAIPWSQLRPYLNPQAPAPIRQPG